MWDRSVGAFVEKALKIGDWYAAGTLGVIAAESVCKTH
jgi:hypothetical protein